MATYEDKWFEVWYADGIDVAPSHLLIVTPNPENRSRVLVIDSYDRDKIVFEGRDYEDALLWLREDDYSLVGGREFPDDGWDVPAA
jgi:hypothetical protein